MVVVGVAVVKVLSHIERTRDEPASHCRKKFLSVVVRTSSANRGWNQEV